MATGRPERRQGLVLAMLNGPGPDRSGRPRGRPGGNPGGSPWPRGSAWPRGSPGGRRPGGECRGGEGGRYAVMRAMDQETLKRAAAERALDYVTSGMRLGIGTGSTARHFVALLGERVAAGLRIVGVPTSEETRRQAEGLGIPLATLDEMPELDLTVDGADEIAPDLSLIKGGGGALLREKIVASASAALVVIADQSKWVSVLGRFPLPIEVVPFGLAATRRAVEAAAAGPALLRRTKDGHAFVTDGGHWILDAALERIPDAASLADRLAAIPGVVEHGLFIGLARTAIIAGPDGVRAVDRA